jgi:hypothetical protein
MYGNNEKKQTFMMKLEESAQEELFVIPSKTAILPSFQNIKGNYS